MEVLQMTEKELYRLNIIQRVKDKLITQVKAAELLGVTDRQVRNLLNQHQNRGSPGLISRKRGMKSNRAFTTAFKKDVISLISELYEDFGPTFAKEKLEENHNINVSTEFIRKLMIEYHLYIPKAKKPKVHQSRPRRENFGELIQIDASIHDWFEGRGDKCALIVFIDDATSRITSLHFHKSECLEGYFEALKSHLEKFGRPLGIYSDRHSIFGGADQIKNAQLVRAFRELGIEGILARSAQAKGRVERANRTLQDRLIKEMRLRNISSIEEANDFLKKYIDVHNEKFSKEPKGAVDTHRPLASSHNLEYILACREERTLSKDLCISFYNKKIKILESNMVNRLKYKKVNVIRKIDGAIQVYYQGKFLRSAFAEDIISKRQVLDHKDKILWKPRQKRPNKNHPWRKCGHQTALSRKIRKEERNVI